MANSKLIYEPGERQQILEKTLEGAREIVVISGYVTAGGFGMIRHSLERCLKKCGRVTLLFGIDRSMVAGAKLIRELGALLGKRNGKLSVQLVIEQPGVTFLHAKVYFARKSSGDHLLVGSFNLTGAGVSSNSEIAISEKGSLSRHYEALKEFIEGIDRRELTRKNYEEIAGEMEAYVIKPDPVYKTAASKTLQERGKQLLAKLAPSKPLPDIELSPLERVIQLSEQGEFLAYDFDLEKLSISSGLQYYQERNVLPKVDKRNAGTARVKQPAISANFPLLPEHVQRIYRSLGTRFGRLLTRYGFKTPLGYWVPKQYSRTLQVQFQNIANDLPDSDDIESDIKEHVKKHKQFLEATISSLLDLAQGSGVRHPSQWKPSGKLSDLRQRAMRKKLPEEKWLPSHPIYKEAVGLISKDLRERVEGHLKVELAIGKVRRLIPRLIPLPLSITSEEIAAQFLGSLVWEVAEQKYRAIQRNTRPAVRELGRSAPKVGPEQILELAELLVNGFEPGRAIEAFYRIFTPPYQWGENLRGKRMEILEDSEDFEEDDA